MSKATKKEKEETENTAKSKPKGKDSSKKDTASKKSTIESSKLFLQESWAEFKKIQWPTPRQAMNESLVVIFTVLFVVALVTLYDWLSSLILSLILVK